MAPEIDTNVLLAAAKSDRSGEIKEFILNLEPEKAVELARKKFPGITIELDNRDRRYLTTIAVDNLPAFAKALNEMYRQGDIAPSEE